MRNKLEDGVDPQVCSFRSRSQSLRLEVYDELRTTSSKRTCLKTTKNSCLHLHLNVHLNVRLSFSLSLSLNSSLNNLILSLSLNSSLNNFRLSDRLRGSTAMDDHSRKWRFYCPD